MLLYEGPSPLDSSKRILVIATQSSKNVKTGPMVQVWVLLRDHDPIKASREGLDQAICGSCPHRGTPTPERTRGEAYKRTCYVAIKNAPLQIFRKYHRGGYGKKLTYKQMVKKFAGKSIRWGAYGDPSLIPLRIVKTINSVASGWTGYTHLWKEKSYQNRKQIFMASTDTNEETLVANKKGWRTFRAGDHNTAPTVSEITCPASKEFETKKGFKLTCQKCQLCKGSSLTSAKNIHINYHGRLFNLKPRKKIIMELSIV